jgi:hypothetical protein
VGRHTLQGMACLPREQYLCSSDFSGLENEQYHLDMQKLAPRYKEWFPQPYILSHLYVYKFIPISRLTEITL